MTVAEVTEIMLAALQIWAIAAKQQGMTEEESKAAFNANYAKFMEESAAPVDPVKRGQP